MSVTPEDNDRIVNAIIDEADGDIERVEKALEKIEQENKNKKSDIPLFVLLIKELNEQDQ